MYKKSLTVMLSALLSFCLAPCPAFAVAEASDGSTSILSGSMITQFTDEDQIGNREAVSVLAGLGVIDGMGDGTFQPQGPLTRAQTAKLIAVFTGYLNQDRFSGASEKSFTDVPDTHWATDYISFGVSQKYLNGMGDGTFDPEGRVTTAHLATILDKILGYVPEDVNRQWPSRAMDIAESSGLLINIAKTAGEPLSREEATQMMLNALEADTRLQTGNQGANSGIYTYQNIRNSSEKDYRKRDDNTQEQLIERLFPNVTCRYYSDDDLGHERAVWRNSKNERIAEYQIVPAFAYTSRKTVPEVIADLEGYTFENAELRLNACKVSSSEGYIQSCRDLAERLTGNGVRTEIYTDVSKKEVTKIISVQYTLKRVINSDPENESVSVENSSGSTVLTARMDFFSNISSAVAGDRIFVAPAYHYKKDRTELRFEADWSDLVDAYMPFIVQGTVTGILPSVNEEERRVSFNGTFYSLINGYNADNLRSYSGTRGIAYLDRYGFFAGFESAGTTEDSSAWLFVKELYRIKDLSTDTFVWYLKGYSETGLLLDLRINDSGTKETASSGVTHRTVLDARIQKTFTWFRPYKEIIDSFGRSDGVVDSEFHVTENSVFLKDGKAVCYQESAAGCFLSEDNRNRNDDVLSYAFYTKENLIGDYYYISGIRLSDTFKAVNIGGAQADCLSVTVSTRAENIPAGSVCIVKKTTPNSLRITSIFAEKESYETTTQSALLRVTAIIGTCVYTDASGESRNDGVLVSYYDADSSNEKTMIIASSEIGSIHPGWYGKLTSFGEAFILEGSINDATSVRWDSTTKSMTGGFYSGSIVSGYNGIISVAGDLSTLSFQFTGDEAVRDLSSSGLRTVDGLIHAVSTGQLTGKVVFSFTTRGEQNLITQLYIL